MRIVVVSIGSELLIGHTINTNLAFIGEQLAGAGYTVDREVCIPDQTEVLASTIAEELGRAQVVITIGGLGPTRDDMTREIAARILGAPLREQPTARRHIEDYLGARLNRLPQEALRVQSLVPQGATALLNDNGTAPGLWCPTGNGALVLLPGPPRELRPIFVEQVLPRLRELLPPDSCRRGLRVCGMPESVVAEHLETNLELEPEIELAYCARAGEVDIRLTAEPTMAQRLDQLLEQIKRLFGQAVVPDSGDLAASVADLLTARGWRLALAESCTGGLLGARLTERPGASDFFTGGVVCYSNQVKRELLGVPEETLQHDGAVSEATVRGMALGIMKRLATETAIAITGIAGPDGGSLDKPVGLVYIATGVNQDIQVRRRVFNGNRESIRQRAATAALNDLRIHLSNCESTENKTT